MSPRFPTDIIKGDPSEIRRFFKYFPYKFLGVFFKEFLQDIFKKFDFFFQEFH